MSPEDLADANLIEAIREHARWQDSCELVERDGLLLLAGSNAFPGAYRNSVVRLDRSVPAAEALGHARDFFAARGRGFTAWARTGRDDDLETLLQSAGLERRSDSPCMLVDTPLADADAPPGIRIETFTDERIARDAVAINAEAYQMIRLPAEETRIGFQRLSASSAEKVVGFVAYRGERPVSTALTIVSGAGAGVYWVGTVSDAQRAGLGGLCTRLATNAGFARGARVVTLQASPFGEPVYRRLGYRTYGRLRWYRHRAPSL